MVICLERGADLHTAQLIPLSLTVSFFSKIQIGWFYLFKVMDSKSQNSLNLPRMYVIVNI